MAFGKRLAFIGGGNMAEALLRGALSAKRLRADEVIGTDVREERLGFLRETYGIATSGSNAEAAAQSEIVLLAVKPQVMPTVLEDVRKVISDRQLVISIAAGVSTRTIAEALSRPVRIVRVMPNTPALVLEGVSALARGSHATLQDMETTRHFFEGVGRVVVVEERLMDAVTGLSGSGPAYVFLVIEALSDAGVNVGLPREVATALAAQTVRGAAQMVLETGKHPAQLKDLVTSPGGTTIAGLQVLENGAVRASLINAVEAAARRAQELGSR